jgi:hypothetical protein
MSYVQVSGPRRISQDCVTTPLWLSAGLSRVLPTGGVEFFGLHIPAGVLTVFLPDKKYTVLVLDRDFCAGFHNSEREEHLGAPEVFRPERWFESAETCKHLLRYLLTFGKGPRACISLSWNTVFWIPMPHFPFIDYSRVISKQLRTKLYELIFQPGV